jgi:hypothetical protein
MHIDFEVKNTTCKMTSHECENYFEGDIRGKIICKMHIDFEVKNTTWNAEHMGARVLPGLLHELMEPSQGMLALVDYSTQRCSSVSCRELWVDQVQHWQDTAHHLIAPTLPEISVLLELEILR